jgi:hypothetical protein
MRLRVRYQGILAWMYMELNAVVVGVGAESASSWCDVCSLWAGCTAHSGSPLLVLPVCLWSCAAAVPCLTDLLVVLLPLLVCVCLCCTVTATVLYGSGMLGQQQAGPKHSTPVIQVVLHVLAAGDAGVQAAADGAPHHHERQPHPEQAQRALVTVRLHLPRCDCLLACQALLLQCFADALRALPVLNVHARHCLLALTSSHCAANVWLAEKPICDEPLQ